MLTLVDDIAIIYKDSSILESFKTAISARFSMKDLGRLEWFAGIKVDYPGNGAIKLLSGGFGN